MTKYLRVTIVDAEEMNLGDYNTFKNWTIPEDEDPKKEGFKVTYEDQDPPHISFCPKEVFESRSLPLQDPKGISIMPEDLNNMVKEVSALPIPDRMTVMAQMDLKSGFFHYDSETADDPEKYKLETLTHIATSKLYEKLFTMMRFVLKWANNGLNHEIKEQSNDT